MGQCTWKLGSPWFVGYETECREVFDGEPPDWIGDNEDIIGGDFVYCPYCGRKINREIVNDQTHQS